MSTVSKLGCSLAVWLVLDSSELDSSELDSSELDWSVLANAGLIEPKVDAADAPIISTENATIKMLKLVILFIRVYPTAR
ncbi:hypothetical protein NARC_30118 [Candidatus Nitrosocosmicus arcticus]|uniref:Uncharacterized protein n=1 Tax=Candidatus Nitrosocosmicus arcticus TaxID=2035267 RepID=A0A557SXS3_9ARCH|nr:hypothetical protein NARC_30118 [Candidatus Nitrosocosmicus arcticus]